MKYDRKTFLINKEIQTSYMLTFLVPMLGMLALLSVLLVFALNSGLRDSVQTFESGFVETLSSSMMGITEPTERDYQRAIMDVKTYLKHYGGTGENHMMMISALLWILIPGLLFIIAQIVLLTVFFSHKIAGPVYRFEIACRRIIAGDYSEEIRLRQGDQMMELADLFNTMTKTTREKLNEALVIDDEATRKDFRTKNTI